MVKSSILPEQESEMPALPAVTWSEADRLAALDRYHILDTPEEEDFDDIVRLAAQICDVPMAAVSFLDRDRQWFKSEQGLGVKETTLDIAICMYTIRQTGVTQIKDISADSRFKDYPYVTGGPKLRFYAAAPLETTEGLPLGTVCIFDTNPRALNEQQLESLEILARQVMKLLELRRALYAKQVSEERLHFALDTSAVIGTWDYDIKEGLVYCDARFARLFSIDPDEAEKGVPEELFTKAVHPDDRDRMNMKTQLAIDTAGEFEEEYRLTSEDGSVRWISAHGHSYNDEHGRPSRFPGAAVDITERKRAEKKHAALVELNEKLPGLRSTAEITGIAAEIMGRTLDGMRAGYGKIDETGEIITIERDWTGAGATSMAGIHFFRDYGPEFAKSVRNGEVIVINDILEDSRTKDSAAQFASVDVRSLINVSIVEDGKVSALFYIHRREAHQWRPGEIQLVKDIAQRTWAAAERVRAEARMEAALKKAEAASIAKTEFLANMSHEIRTPMNAIIGLSAILMSEGMTPRQQEFMQTLQLSADSLLTLINDLLDISKIESRTIELEKIPFNLNQCVAEVISMMNVKIEEKGLNLVVENDLGTPRWYIGDPARLRQIIVNLCGNAIKFTEQGSVVISVHATPHGEMDDVDDVCISVKDTGVGIPKDKLDDIFEKFVQADSSISRKFGGTGLGLAITKTLATIMGGTVAVDSEVGQGSTFTICLPLKRTDMPEIPPGQDYHDTSQMKAQASGAQRRILLVEDYAPNILVAGSFLEEFGYEWESAKSGAEAVEMALSGSYAAILMDVQMFGMNGLEATRAIRVHERENSLPAVPIIGMTAHALAGDREKCIEAGMNDYISKPFNPDELQHKIRALVDGL